MRIFGWRSTVTALAVLALVVTLTPSAAAHSAASASSSMPPGSLLDVGPTGGTALSQYEGGNWANPDPVDLYSTANGDLAVVSHTADRLTIRTYNTKTLTKVGTTRTIDLSGWPDWGGFYAGPDGYFYVLVGRDNPAESDDRTVVAVRRYTASWQLAGTAYLKGLNGTWAADGSGALGIYAPFDGGDPDMVLVGHRLVVHMSRLIYAIQGVHHQVNLTFEVNTTTMKATTFDKLGGQSYSSHSFQQLVAKNGKDLVFVDHGDAYPRAIQLGVMANYPTRRNVRTYNVMTFGGAEGDNYTGAAVTDLISGPQGVVVVGHAIPNPGSSTADGRKMAEQHNIFAISADPATGKHTTRWLTDLPAASNAVLRGPRVVQVGSDRFAVLFGVQTDNATRLEYRLMDSSGRVRATKTFYGVSYTSSSAPILLGDTIYQVVFDPSGESGSGYLQALRVTDPANPELIATWCPPSPFPDVSASNPHCENVAWLMTLGITKPADGRYHPADSVTRGAMTAFLFRLLHPGKASPGCTSRPYPDVKTDSVFCGYIRWAKDNGIAYGYPNGTFGPDNAVTRGAMAAFLHRIATDDRVPACTRKPFADVATGDVFCGVITWMKANGITYGIGHDDYGTTLPVTRQAMASFLHRIEEFTS